MSKKFFVTTSIAYLNSEPHLGFAWESVQADVLARYYRQAGFEVFFQTGTDEHGSKVKRAAEENKKSTQEFTDELAGGFQALKKTLDLSWDNFIRTTDQKNHWPVAKEIWNRLLESGDLYKKKYGGYYCVGCESFKTDRDIVDGECVIHKKKLEFLEEENWFFRLSKYTSEIESKIKNDELKIAPESRKNEVLSLLKEGLEDVSFSRSKKYLEWGIPLPNDEDQVMYVWADALTNYISGYGGIKKWQEHPADVHIIGKDILRFHAAIWPAMLISAKLSLPQSVFVHGFVLADGEKMSKSLGNVVDPRELVKKYGVDPVRYYLLREVPSAEDMDFSYGKFEERYDGDLANGLGNFAARVLALGSQFERLRVVDIETSIANEIRIMTEAANRKTEVFKFNEALISIWELIKFGDRYVNDKKPWDKSLDTGAKEKIVYNALMILRSAAILVGPFIPQTADMIISCFENTSDGYLKIKRGGILYPRLVEKR